MRRALVPAVLLVLVPCSGWPQGGDRIGPEFRVNTYTTNDQGAPAVAADSAGNFVVVWENEQQAPGNYISVFGQRYAGSGTPLGSEFLISSSPPETQHLPSVAADSTGNFVVVWLGSFLSGGSLS